MNAHTNPLMWFLVFIVLSIVGAMLYVLLIKPVPYQPLCQRILKKNLRLRLESDDPARFDDIDD